MLTKKEYQKLARNFRRQDLVKLNNAIEFGQKVLKALNEKPHTCQLALLMNEQANILDALRQRRMWITGH